MRIIIIAFSILLAAAPSGAFAHAFLDHAAPRVGSTVTPAPKEMVLWFTQQLEPAFSSIEVRNEQGANVTGSNTTVDGDRTQMRVRLKALPPGTYKVIWHVLSVDTHRTDGNFTFRVGP